MNFNSTNASDELNNDPFINESIYHNSKSPGFNTNNNSKDNYYTSNKEKFSNHYNNIVHKPQTSNITYESDNAKGTINLNELSTLNYQSFNPNSEKNHHSIHSDNSIKLNHNSFPHFSLDLSTILSIKGNNNASQYQNKSMSVERTKVMNKINRKDYFQYQRIPSEFNSNQSISDKNKSFEDVLKKKANMTFVDENVLKIKNILAGKKAEINYDIKQKNYILAINGKKQSELLFNFEKQISSINNINHNALGFNSTNLQTKYQVSSSQNFVNEKVQKDNEFSSNHSSNIFSSLFKQLIF